MAVSASVLALVASVVAAVGPADAESDTYSWPPQISSVPAPDRGYYAPLPLLNRVPRSIDVLVPCDLARPLKQSEAQTVLATARRPELTEGLRITQARDALRIGVGGRRVTSVPWPESCPLRLAVRDGELRLADRTIELRTGALDDMPIVTGLFTDLDVRAGEPPRVLIRTRTYATSQTWQQTIAAVLAVALVLAALGFLARSDRRPQVPRSLRHGIRSAWDARHPTDVVVVVTLVVWWIVAPPFFDDSFRWVAHRLFDEAEFRSYFGNWGVSAPQGYWLELLRHWSVGGAEGLIVMQLPTLFALLAAWPLCRWCLARVVSGEASQLARWTLAGAFLVSATAWGMTLRTEPFASLLALASLTAMVSFVRAPRIAPLLVAAPAAVLAVNAHPAGVVAIAPVLAASPEVFRWLRSAARAVILPIAALLFASLAVFLLVFALDADLSTRLGDAGVVRTGDLHDEPWWREYIRYTTFDQNGGGTAVRRLSLAFVLLCVVAWLTRSRGTDARVLTLPARATAVALALLALTPSKWPWHFGAFGAMAAVAVAAEVARLVRAESKTGRLPIRSLYALIVLGTAAIWSWRASGGWSRFDLQELRWSDGFGVTGTAIAGGLVVAAVVISSIRRTKGGRESVGRFPASAGWAVPIVSFAVVGVTIVVLLVDAAVSPWSPTRQSLDALAGRDSCGLAHQLQGEGDVRASLERPGAPTLLIPPVSVYFPCARVSSIANGVVELPTLIVYQDSPWPLRERDAAASAIADLDRLDVVARGPRGVEVARATSGATGFVRLDAVRTTAG